MALAASAWAILAAVPLFEEAQLQAVGRRIIMHESFRIPSLEKIEAAAVVSNGRFGCNERYLQGILLVRSVLAEDALSRGDLGLIDTRLPTLDESARELLRCSPYQGFGWFVLYWASLNREGATPQALEFLKMSYTVAPREGWIALMRNLTALRVADLLPEDFQVMVANEWRDLVKAGLHGFATASIGQASPAQRERLVATTASIPLPSLRVLSRQILRAGYDIDFPTLPRTERFRD